MMVIMKQMRKNSNIFENKKDLSAHRPTDAASHHKRVNPIPKINARKSSNLKIAKQNISTLSCSRI